MTQASIPLTIIGDIGVDIVLGPVTHWPETGTEMLMERSEVRAGGSGGNAVLAVNKLGGTCRLLSCLGNDRFGHWLGEQFAGIQTSLPQTSTATSLSVGIVHASGERTFLTTHGHLEALAYEHVRPALRRATADTSIVLLTGVFLTPTIRRNYVRLLDDIIALGHEVAIDPGWPPEGWTDELRAEMAQWLSRCDHLLVNETEAVHLAATQHVEDAIPRIGKMLKPGASVVVKTGPRGALGYQKDAIATTRARGEVAFDTIGAGDSFNAGYLLGRLKGLGLKAALDSGSEAAAAILSRFPRQSGAQNHTAALSDSSATPMTRPAAERTA